MKRFVFSTFVIMALVVPMLAQTMPCKGNTLTPTSYTKHETKNDSSTKPCPYMVNIQKSCDALMSLSACLDMDKTTVLDTTGLKTVKTDTQLVAILPLLPWQKGIFSKKVARAPPTVVFAPVSYQSIILTTHRFRV